MATVSRMRTAQQVYNQIHQEDPESSVSLWYIRSVIKQGKFPVIKAGNKFLINYDRFLEYLAGSQANEKPEEAKQQGYGVIRRVAE